jgi:hypothetical protein
MSVGRVRVATRGKTLLAPAAAIDDRTVIVTGQLLKTATIHDEGLVEGVLVPDPASFLSKLKASGLKTDIFSFPQSFLDPQPKHDYYYEWDNFAVAATTSFKDWWEKLSQVSRKNARRAAKRGVVVKIAPFDDELVRGIKAIYDETPVRQGRRFWHYGKDLTTVKEENATYLDRTVFIGAYHEGELIGFIKFVLVGRVAVLQQILSRVAHYDKRPMNAMLTKAIEVCQEKGASHLVYSKFTYGRKAMNPLAEFKRRNGFEQLNFPRYYVPITLKGRLALALRLHRGLLETLPPSVIDFFLLVRSKLLAVVTPSSERQLGTEA